MSTRTINELDGEPNDREDEEPPTDDTTPAGEGETGETPAEPVASGGSGKDKNYGAGNVLTRAAAMLQGMRDRGELSGDETSPAAGLEAARPGGVAPESRTPKEAAALARVQGAFASLGDDKKPPSTGPTGVDPDEYAYDTFVSTGHPNRMNMIARGKQITDSLQDPEFRSKHEKVLSAYRKRKAELRTSESLPFSAERRRMERDLGEVEEKIQRVAVAWAQQKKQDQLDARDAELKADLSETLRLNETQLKTFKERLYKRIMEQIKTNEHEETQKSFFTIANESMNDISAIEEHLNDFLEYSREKLELSKPVSIKFISDQENAQNTLGKTAFYDPGLNEISLYVDNRHPKDVMRSLSHEMVHHAQNGRGQFEGAMVVGEQGYAQNDAHLREMEREAYECGNMIFRDWEDGVKQQVPLAEWRRDELSNRLMERMGLKPKEIDIDSFRCIVESNSDNDDENTNIEENCGCQDPTSDHGPSPEGDMAMTGAEGKEDIEGLAAAALAAVHQLAAASGADVSTTVATGEEDEGEGEEQGDLEWYYEQLNKRMMDKI